MKIDYKNYHRDKDYAKMRSTFRNIFLTRYKLLYRYIQKGRVLEIGSSVGTFLEIFKEHGFEVYGVEPSESSKLAKSKNIKIYEGYFEKLDLPKNYFNLVIMNHTLEHMEDPEQVLNKVHSLLKSEGIVFIDVPNAGGLGSILMGKRWPYRLPGEHRWQFTKQMLKNLLSKSKFEVLFWQSKAGFFEYANPIKELTRKGFLRDILGLPFSAVATAVNMGDSITFIARKK